jgi:hypothetical protein
MVTPLRSWIVVADPLLSMRAFCCCLAGTATQRRGYNRFNASTIYPGLAHQGRGGGVGRGLGFGMSRPVVDRTLRNTPPPAVPAKA